MRFFKKDKETSLDMVQELVESNRALNFHILMLNWMVKHCRESYFMQKCKTTKQIIKKEHKTMPEYIEREDALKELNRNSITKKITLADGVSIFDTIKNIPAADVVEVNHGEWIKDNNFSQIVNKFKCSLCGVEDIVLHHNYCPNCGAKMDLKEGADNG